jgi:hypothetical protein
MLKSLSDRVKTCLRLAEDCARRAALQSDPKLRRDFLDNEARWLKLARSYELSERLSAFTQTSGKIYSIHVWRKTGVWKAELQTRLGVLPRPGDEIAAILHGDIVKGGVTVITTDPRPATGSSSIEVRAEEI